jgi:hypothetical protein
MALTSRGARSGLGESYIKAGALARVLQRQREVRRRRRDREIRTCLANIFHTVRLLDHTYLYWISRVYIRNQT